MKKISWYITGIALNIMFWLPVAYATQGDEIVGMWITENKDSRVEIYKEGERYFGKIVALKNPEEQDNLDEKNPNKEKRSQPLIGLILMSEFEFTGDKWENGKIYDPDNGKTYRCKISLEKDGTLHVRGYIGVSALGRTTIWENARVYWQRELQFLGIDEHK